MKTKNFSGMEFFKLSGAGNDFIFLIEDSENFKKFSSVLAQKELRREMAISLCKRDHNVGADGLVFLKNLSADRFQWDFYNADGSDAEMCGNAARCAGRLIFDRGLAEKTISLKTLAGEIICRDGEDISVTMPPATRPEAKSFKIEGQEIAGTFVNTGVPHFVLDPRQLLSEPVNFDKIYSGALSMSRLLRNHIAFGSEGTNVTWAWKSTKCFAVTFERGVEAFTKACGTGAVATGVVLQESHVQMPGGELKVHFENLQKPELIGGARIIYQGLLREDSF